MKKAIVISLFLILVTILAGCDQVDITKVTKEDVNKVIACEKPYIRFASGCCLDKNENKVCDNDESIPTSTDIADKEPARAAPESVVPAPIKEEVDTPPVNEVPEGSQDSGSFDLAKYPYFGTDKNIDFTIIVGDSAPQSDIMGSIDIATSLQFASRLKDFTGTVNLETKLSGEISDLSAYNSIVIGNPCVNPTSAKLLGNPTNCTEGFEEGKATIKVLQQPSGKATILVAGYGGMETRMAAKALAGYAKWQSEGKLKGTEVEVYGTFTEFMVRPWQPT
ncbi:hypothetical protein HYU40_03535 [Candidatus Woesearchaeota archaeon]|nr:hypothetical protein [Candidatus Woesearchaeota archaeon]